MYTVLIVDDEEPVLESYGFILESGVENFTLAGKARSGYEAIKLIYELRPDVVFMDINMPGLNGLDAIAEVHGKFSDTVFVLSTAYERFDLARRAIPLGVFSYLVKPVGKKQFVETLADIAAMLDKRRAEAGQDAGGDGRINRNGRGGDSPEKKFMSECLWKAIGGEEWRDHRSRLSLESDRGLVCFVGLDSEKENIFPLINRALELKYRFLFAMHLNLGMYFFPGDVDTDGLVPFLTGTVASVAGQNTVAVAGFGSVRAGPELHLSCAEALEDLNRKKNSTDVSLRERMRIIEIRRKMGFSGLEEVLPVFTAYWEEVFSAYDFAVAKAKMTALFALLIDDCSGYYQSHGDETPPFNPAEEIAPLPDLSSWNAWVQPSFARLAALSRLKRSSSYPVPLVKALAFINEKFCAQIQLPDAADAASVSAAYLSRLFGEHMDSSFIDYLTVLRIERAEKLIRENRSNIKEVSFAVGYQDPNYFSKIFKKIVGVSPSMYAERNRE